MSETAPSDKEVPCPPPPGGQGNRARKKIQAKDLSDTQFMKSVLKHGLEHYYDLGWHKRSLLGRPVSYHPFVMRSEVEADFPDFPWKVLLAKAASLIRRGWIEGCSCGCRGDYQVLF